VSNIGEHMDRSQSQCASLARGSQLAREIQAKTETMRTVTRDYALDQVRDGVCKVCGATTPLVHGLFVSELETATVAVSCEKCRGGWTPGRVDVSKLPIVKELRSLVGVRASHTYSATGRRKDNAGDI